MAIPSDLDALISLSSLCNTAAVSEFKRPESSNGISSTHVLVSWGRLVLLTHANLHMATVELIALANDSNTCLAVDSCCFAAASLSNCDCNALALASSGRSGTTVERSSRTL